MAEGYGTEFTLILIAMYLVTAYKTKTLAYALAFFIMCLIPYIQMITFEEIYLIDIIVYAIIYKISERSLTRGACILIILHDLVILNMDRLNEYYAALAYNSIEWVSLCTHILLIVSIIYRRKTRSSMENYINSIRQFFGAYSNTRFNSFYSRNKTEARRT